MRLAPSSASSGIYLGDGSSDYDVARPFLKFVQPGMIAFDCGAHVGEYTLLFARLVGQGGAVHSFEPDPRMFDYLEWNVNRNRLENVTINTLALSERIGHALYSIQSDGTTSSFARFSERDALKVIEVETTTLDEYVRANSVPRIDAMKIDVEGAEEAVLAGAADLLTRRPPRLVFVECHNAHSAAEVRKGLERAGYVIERSSNGHLHQHVVARRMS